MLPPCDFLASIPFASILAESGPNLARAAGRFHPLIVHFPIALALVAVGVEWWRSLSRQEGLSPLTRPLLWIAAASAVFATATGWINAAFDHANNESDTLALHRWIGTGTSVALVGLAWWCQLLSAEAMTASARVAASIGTFRWGALLGAIAVGVSGHLGGNLIHGSDYLTEHLLPRPAKPVEAPKEEPTVELSAKDRFFLDKVRPIFEANCFECHGARKQKGGLRMDSKSWLFNGAEDKWTVQPFNAAESLLLHRVELDRTDPDAMPPEGDGLTGEEKAVIRQWIDAGAVYPDLPGVAGGGIAPGVPSAASNAVVGATAVALGNTSTPQVSPAAKAKADAAAKALLARGVLVQPLALDSPLFDVNASRADPAFGDADAALLADLAPLVANLNLSKSALTDAGFAKLSGMANLERLRLDGTAAGDAGIRALGALPKLESVNLIATKVTPALVDWFAAQPGLKRVYVWQTALDTPELLGAIRAGGRIQAIGADVPLAQPKGPPMPEDPKPEEKPAAERPADKPA